MSESDSTLSSVVPSEDSSDDSDLSTSLESMTESDDEKDSLLPKTFKEKEPKLEFSDWSLSKLRRFFLGQPITKEERTSFTEKYYVLPKVYELFQTGKFAASPLSMLKANGSNASRDASFAHSEVNFGLRLQINLYEKFLVQFGKFADERISKKKTIAAGIYNDLKFPHTSNSFIFPNPKDAMTAVSLRSIEKFKDRFDTSEPDFADNVCRYALGYKDAFLALAKLVGPMILFGEKADNALTDTKAFLETSLEQLGDATRLTGSASQALKSLREKEYLQKTDQAFKSFVGMKKANLSLEEQKEERLAALDEKKFLQKAKEYSKLKRAVAVVTKEKTLARINAQKKIKGKGKAATASPKAPGPGKAKRAFKKKKIGKKSDNKRSDNEKDDE